MFRDRFDESSEQDILRYAGGLIGKTLAQVASIPDTEADARGKGRIGLLVEKYYFGYEPNNDALPDFPKANLELKVTGLKSRTGEPPVAKERLALNLISYYDLVHETFETSSFFLKCQKLLILCYRYEESAKAFDQVFTENQFIYRLADHDLQVIKRDWEFIQKKVRDGKAHELSEGDTFFLKANRKGAGGEKDWTGQPFSDELAYRRGWSFNGQFLTALIRTHASVPVEVSAGLGEIEQAVELCFKRFYGGKSDDLFRKFNLVNSNGKMSKSIRYDLAKRLLAEGDISLQDLGKAGIRLKTVRLKANGATRESMSFPAFDYEQIAKQEWEDSDFSAALEEKFLFVVFWEDGDGNERLLHAGYWNMPYSDRQQAKSVWEMSKSRILDGSYVFPGESLSDVAHVRPHGRTARDVAKCPDGEYRMRRCFWLNKKYVERVVSTLL